ncbi:MAG: ISNCY family transposase, partial [Chloroflexi bacterium]|nr:ISNCY family transposase [Chloroflexota bacterium]
RLVCRWDFDKLTDIANNHITLRLMLGHSPFGKSFRYALQTVKDNIRLFKPEILDKICQIVVNHGHDIIGNADVLNGGCDSFVVETDVHFPTDINLLLDALRKIIFIIMALCKENGITVWRKGMFNFKKIKRLFTQISRMKHSSSKNSGKKEERNQLIKKAHELYLDLAQAIVDKAKESIILLCASDIDVATQLKIDEIRRFIAHAERQINQIRRRVIDGETIPHHEKVFSVFEEHTKWICKGKAGVPYESGLNICIVKDQSGFILHHRNGR